MIIRKFVNDDLSALIIQPEQAAEYECVRPDSFDFTIEHNGMVLGVFGLLKTGQKRLCVSSFISQNSRLYMLMLIRTLKRILEDGMKKTGNTAIDMTVLARFENGRKLAKLLGFSLSQTLPAYFNGQDYELYTRRF